MSTRAVIKLDDCNIQIYKHSDGYPEDVMPVLKEFTKMFFEKRGHDPEYFIAQLLRAFAARDRDECIEKHGLEHVSKYLYDQDYLGWGVMSVGAGNCGADYVYRVDQDGTIYINGSES